MFADTCYIMLTCKSPQTVMLVAYRFAQQTLPDYSSPFNRLVATR